MIPPVSRPPISRTGLGILGGLLLFMRLLGADVSALATESRQAAEQVLAEARTRMATERRDLIKQVQAAQKEAEQARDRARTALETRRTRETELQQRSGEQRTQQTAVRLLADRALAAARPPANQARELAKAPPAEGVDAALKAIGARIEAVPGKLAARFGTERIITRQSQLAEVPVLRLGQARAVAYGDTDATRGLLTLAIDGTQWIVTGPVLPGLTSVPSSSFPNVLLLDPDGTAINQAPLKHRTLAEWVKAGRAWIWPILVAFGLGLAVSLWRSVALFRSRIDPRRLIQVADLLHRHQAEEAKALVAAGATSLDRVLAAGIEARNRPREVREAAVEQALLAETPDLQRGLGVIVVLASIAPLLGLLGTVTGMIDMFSVISEQGSGNAKSLSGAISEALICTQAGMIAAIPLLLIHAALSRLADRRLLLLEEAACGMLGLAEHGEATQPAQPASSK